MPNKDIMFEWASTATLIAGVALTSFNIHPVNLWVSLLGNVGWLILGIKWKKSSLAVLQAVISAIYVVGLIQLYVNQ